MTDRPDPVGLHEPFTRCGELVFLSANQLRARKFITPGPPIGCSTLPNNNAVAVEPIATVANWTAGLARRPLPTGPRR